MWITLLRHHIHELQTFKNGLVFNGPPDMYQCMYIIIACSFIITVSVIIKCKKNSTFRISSDDCPHLPANCDPIKDEMSD